MRRLYTLALLALVLVSCSKRKSIEEQFAEEARMENQQQCPSMIDACTMMDSIKYDTRTHTKGYFYTFYGEMDDASFFTPYMKEDIRERRLLMLANDIKMKKYMDEGINFHYVYFSNRTGEPLLEFTFGQKDYKGHPKLRSFEERMVAKWGEFSELNCPQEQDEYTVLESVEYLPEDSTLCYRFTLAGEFDVQDFDEMFPTAEQEMQRALEEGLKDNPTLQEEVEAGCHFNYLFCSKKTGKVLLEVRI